MKRQPVLPSMPPGNPLPCRRGAPTDAEPSSRPATRHAWLSRLGDLLPRASFAVLALILAVPPAGAELGEVLHTIPCAGSNTSDLAWVDGVLYQVIFAPTEQKNIYRLDPTDGTVLGIVPYAGSSPQGLTFDGHNLWQSDISGDAVYKLDPLTGEIRDQWGAPGGADGQPLGPGWDGEALWLADSRDPEKIWLVDTLGAPLGQIPAPGDSPYGLAWAEGYIWVSENSVGGLGVIYQLDPADGSIVDSFDCPGGGGAPNGITHDGQHLWVADNTTDLIYQVDDGIGPSGVEPVMVPRSPGVRIDQVAFSHGAIQLRFTARCDGPLSVQIIDVRGRTERSVCVPDGGREAVKELRLDAVGLPSGVHFVRLAAPRATAVGRVVVVR